MDRTKIAVAPETRPAMYAAMRDAAIEAGAEIVPVEQASALMWADPLNPGEFPGVVASGQSLGWVQLPFAGIENFVGQLDGRLIWTCGKGVYADPVAEHVITLTLAGFRYLHISIPATSWPAQEGRNLLGANVVIVGAGGITESLVRLLEPWRAHVSVIRRQSTPMAGVERTVAQSDEAAMHELLAGADVVVIAAALTPETTGMVDAAFLDAMAEDAWLINVGRGAHVDNDALLDALRAGLIGGAALDVATPEPLPDGHPLWDEANCIITPHVANTPEMGLPLIANRVRINVARWIAGDELDGLVDVEAGY